MKKQFMNLATLETLNRAHVEKLQKLNIRNLGDLLAFQPIRYAKYIRAAADQLLRKDEIAEYVDSRIRDKDAKVILESGIENLKELDQESAGVLHELGIHTIADLADYPPFVEAENVVTRAVAEENDPYAPSCVLPSCKKFTRNRKRYVSFFKQDEIRHLSILSSGPSLVSNLFRFGNSETKLIYLGYSVSYLQEWIYCGVHLGEPRGSVNLFMGQDSQVSMLDWRRAMRASRQEDARLSERLAHTLFHQRAVDEVARATAEEHQFGGTSAFGANAATAGSFVAAGALVGGVGGGVSGALTGLAVDALLLGSDAGLGTISGAVVGTAVGGLAGAAAGSLIYSGATTLGFVESDAEGDREMFARSAQDIQQNTIQNSSSIRSFWSNIISQTVEDEQQEIRTERVTNHNRIHALNALYFEVLNEYKVNITGQSFSPILFLPFKPISFDEYVLRKYWWLIRTLLNDKALVTAIDEHFLTLTSNPSPATELAELPEIGDVESSKIVVEVNLDGSMMESLVEGLFKAAVGSAIAGFAGFVASLLVQLYDAFKRDQVKVSLVTSDGTKSLTRVSSPNTDKNYVGQYETTSRIPIHTIEKVTIINDNAEFNLGVPVPFFGLIGIKVNELAFEDITAQLTIRNKSRYTGSLPTIGSLENKKTIRSETINISANSRKDISWNIADRLRDLFEGIEDERTSLTEEVEEEQSIEARISKLLGFLNANKYGFTRFILDRTEREQVIQVLEEVEIGGLNLSDLASTNPLGFCGNHVVLPLKNCALNAKQSFEPFRFDTTEFEFYLNQFDQISTKTDTYVKAVEGMFAWLDKYLSNIEGDSRNNKRELHFIKLLETLKLRLEQFQKVLGTAATAHRGDGLFGISIEEVQGALVGTVTRSQLSHSIEAAINQIWAFLRDPTKSNQDDMSRLCGYYTSVKDSLESRMGQLISSDDISLPSPAIFMEPVLSNSKGAELYDMQRNSHWEVLSAPTIGTTDPNVLRARDITLEPNVPDANLTIQNTPEYPMPTSITAALTEAGKLNLSTLLSTNAGTLTSTLSGLASMATELAKASTQLTGEAQKQALAASSDVAKQVSDIIAKSIQPPSGNAPAAPPTATKSPQTQQEKAEIGRRAKEIDADSSTPQQKTEQKKTIGAATTPDDKRDYQFSIAFLDQDGIPYLASSFQFILTLSLFELSTVVYINGGGPLDLAPEGFFFPEPFTLTKGRKVKLNLVADIDGVRVPGDIVVSLPDSPDIAFECKMKSETREVQANTVKEAIDTALETSGFGLNANVLLDLFLNAGAKFPFLIAKINADGTAKTVLDLKGEYNRSSSTTTGDTTTTTTLTTYKVTTPLNGWSILMK